MLTDDGPLLDRLGWYAERTLPHRPVRIVVTQHTSLRNSAVDGWVLDARFLKAATAGAIKGLRLRGSDTPIVALNAISKLNVTGYLLAGADDATEAGEPESRIAVRILAFLRRAWLAAARDRVCVGNLVIDRPRQQAWCAGVPLHVTPRQFRMLECLATNANSVVSATRLRDYLWVYRGTARPSRNSVEAHIASLRRLLRASASVSIRTVPKEGYALVLGDQSEHSAHPSANWRAVP